MKEPRKAIAEQVAMDLTAELGDELEGLIASGSYVQGNFAQHSDVDLFAVLSANRKQRRAFYIKGVPVELLLEPTHKIRKELEEKVPHTVQYFAHGEILYDPSGQVASLVEFAKRVLENGPTPLDLTKYPNREKVQHISVELLKDAEDRAQMDEEGAAFVLHQALIQILSDYYKIVGRWPVKPKYQIEDLRIFDPKKAALAVKVLAQSIPLHARISALSDLIDEIITPIGGRLSEWNSPWEQIE